MKWLPWHSAACVFGAILVAFLFYWPETETNCLLTTNSDGAYANLLSTNTPLHTLPESALSGLRPGDSATAYKVQAEALMPALPNYEFLPHIAHTVVIAIDRDYTNVEINSFSDLLHTKEHITFDLGDRFDPNDWASPKAQHIVLAMSEALYGHYDTKALGQFMGELWREHDRFHYMDMWQPILVTTDTTAVALKKEGRNFDIVIPSDGTITLTYGLLLHETASRPAEGFDEALIATGYRLPDGRSDSRYYPADYRNAHPPEDPEAYRAASEALASIIRRETFSADQYGFANVVELTLGYLLFTAVVVLHLCSILQRVTDRRIRRTFFLAGCLQIFFLATGLVKYFLDGNPWLETALWYSYYLPLLGLPALFVYVMICAKFYISPAHHARRMRFYRVYLAILALLFLCIATNHLHEWIFVVTDYEHSYHTYGPGYYVVLGTLYLSIFTSVVSLARQYFASPRRGSFIFPVLMIIGMLYYSYGHIANLEFIVGFELSFAISILYVLFAELCMYSRLIPHNKGYHMFFLHSRLAMKLQNLARQTVESSLVTELLDENYVLREFSITGGYLLYFEDHSSLNVTREKLAQINEERRKNNEFLRQKSKVNADLAAMAAERRVHESIDEVLLTGTAKIELLLSTISTQREHTRTMDTINLLACTMKRECMFRINALYQRQQHTDLLLQALAELKGYTAPLGITLTASCRLQDTLPTAQMLCMYALCAAAAEEAIATACPNMVVQLYREGDAVVFSILGEVPLLPQKVQQVVLAATAQPSEQLCTKDWEETVCYRFTVAKEVAS